MNAELIAELRGHILSVPLTLLHDAADALEAAEKRIAELEAQIPKEGEWVMCESEKPYIVCKCSVCGDMTSEYGHYCPNCGARMKGANDEQD